MGGRVQLALMGAALSVLIAPTVRAEEVGNGVGAWERGSVDEWMSGRVDEFEQSTPPSTHLPIHPITPPLLSDLESSATTVTDWIAQIEASLVQITGVRVEETEAGLQVVLETADGTLDVPETRSIGNALIADIPNATIVEEFSQANPIEGIALVSVTSLPGDRVRVAITGTDAPPVAEVSAEAQGLVLSVALGEAGTTAEEDAIQVVVTGEQDEGYRATETSVGTRTDTLLRDIPQAINVVPQQVIQDTQARSITEALENVPGVVAQGAGSTGTRDYFTIRGFEVYSNSLVNGLPDPQISSDGIFFNVERLEVLKGPASVLYGETGFSGIGGTINYVTRQPLSEPFYEVSASAGNYGFYQGSVDLSGPLNAERTILYRLIGGIRSFDSITDFNSALTLAVAPSLRLQLGENTSLLVEGDVNRVERNGQQPGPQPVLGTVLPNPNGEIPRSFNPIGPLPNTVVLNGRIGYLLEHQFNENLRLRNAFRYVFANDDDSIDFFPGNLEADNRTLNRTGSAGEQYYNYYLLDTNLLSRFNTGTIEHQLLAGFSLSRNTTDLSSEFGIPAAPVDIFDPVYDQTLVTGDRTFSRFTTRDTLGIYLQDQISLSQNLQVLLGGRFDTFSERATDRLTDTDTSQSDTAFSPRLGIVYQPIQPISLYASYSRSFAPTIGIAASGENFQPERGTQYEIGVKADLTDRLSATLAFYDLTRSNVTTPDPNTPNFSVQTGRQRSRGIEFDVGGEILPGWNITAGYAYTDARVTEDNSIPVGNRLFNSPEHAVNLWTTYRIQTGSLEGLGFGLGLYYLGDRPLDNANTVELPGFLRTDAAIFYERNQFRAALNFRNLFDVESYVSRYGSSTLLQVGTPFTVQGTLSWRF
jgi:iron complex outermembrane recepter protein